MGGLARVGGLALVDGLAQVGGLAHMYCVVSQHPTNGDIQAIITGSSNVLIN